MRKKTDQKKQSILDAANELFRDQGFEKTSMVDINTKAGCSKRTLYNYFSSKEVLYVESLSNLVENYGEDIFSSLRDPQADLKTALLGLGEKALRLTCAPSYVAARRLIISEADRSGTGKQFYEKFMSWQEKVASYFAKAMDEGKLRHEDPLMATMHWQALLEAEVLAPCLLGVCKLPLSRKTIRAAAERAVSGFLRIYAPD